jgi:ABC-2 type transport system ATP-binding protein
MIEVQQLTKTFGQTQAVKNLTFTVPAGRVTGFLGPNGAGKSTTMRCMLLLDRPDTGRCTFAGKRLDEFAQPLREVGALLDAKYVHPTRSARNHLRYLAASNSLPLSRVDECLELTGLTEVAKKRVGGFSLGMHQRLGLAGALLGDPATLLFDEPVNGLDPEGILWIRNFMRYLAGQGRTVLVSSHLLSEMAQTADELVVIGRGELISQGPVREFVSRSTRSWIQVRSPQSPALAAALAPLGAQITPQPDGALHVSGPDAATIGETAARHGIVLHELSPQTGSLEEAFLEATRSTQEYHSGFGPAPAVGWPLGPPPGGPPPAAGGPTLPPPAVR